MALTAAQAVRVREIADEIETACEMARTARQTVDMAEALVMAFQAERRAIYKEAFGG